MKTEINNILDPIQEVFVSISSSMCETPFIIPDVDECPILPVIATA